MYQIDRMYHIAIPSYKRHQTIAKKTLATLKRYSIDLSNVSVFVVEDEYDLYKQTCPDVQIIIGKLGLHNQRSFINSYFPAGSAVVFLDDDIEDFFFLEKDSLTIDEVFKRGFDTCKKEGCRLWGIYPVANRFFMDSGYSLSLAYIIGSCYGLLLDSPEAEFDRGDKEDVFRSCQYFSADKKVIRFKDVSVKSKYYTEKGGLQETRTQETNLLACQKICTLFPSFCTLWIRPRTGMAEIRLRQKIDRPCTKKASHNRDKKNAWEGALYSSVPPPAESG